MEVKRETDPQAALVDQTATRQTAEEAPAAKPKHPRPPKSGIASQTALERSTARPVWKVYAARWAKLYGARPLPTQSALRTLEDLVAATDEFRAQAIVWTYLALGREHYQRRRHGLEVLVEDINQIVVTMDDAWNAMTDEERAALTAEIDALALE